MIVIEGSIRIRTHEFPMQAVVAFVSEYGADLGLSDEQGHTIL